MFETPEFEQLQTSFFNSFLAPKVFRERETEREIEGRNNNWKQVLTITPFLFIFALSNLIPQTLVILFSFLFIGRIGVIGALNYLGHPGLPFSACHPTHQRLSIGIF